MISWEVRGYLSLSSICELIRDEKDNHAHEMYLKNCNPFVKSYFTAPIRARPANLRNACIKRVNINKHTRISQYIAHPFRLVFVVNVTCGRCCWSMVAPRLRNMRSPPCDRANFSGGSTYFLPLHLLFMPFRYSHWSLHSTSTTSNSVIAEKAILISKDQNNVDIYRYLTHTGYTARKQIKDHSET